MKRWMFLALVLAVAFSSYAWGEDTAAKPETTAPQPEVQEVLIADFEGWPNNLGGDVGIYGSLEPDWDKKETVPYSWIYELMTPGYNPANVHSGKQSFRLVNGLGTKPELTWGSFAMDLGPTTNPSTTPKKVESFDTSGYEYLTFWVKGEKGGEKMELIARDAGALSYMPQGKYNKFPMVTTEWQKIVVPLSELAPQVNLTALDSIGLSFGKDIGNNAKGEIIYLDDFIFTNNP